MPRKKTSGSSDQLNPLSYLITFSDLITLLLTFFVLMIAMSSMDVKAIKQAFGLFLSGASGVLDFTKEGPPPLLGKILAKMEPVPATVRLDKESLKEAIFRFEDLEFQKLMALVDRDIHVIQDERGLVIQIADYILFNQGGAVLRHEYLPILSRLADVLRGSMQPISIEGHTDTSPLDGGGATWAWELSLERALAVMRYFLKEGGMREDRFRVGGFGPSQPLAPNDSPQNRTKNRRIEIILYRETLG